MITKTNRNKSSFRIKTLEILNFGGYHLRPTRLALNSDGVVFSGPNGAGKSTALDALRLIVRDRPRFNSASAETSSGRSVESYYTGTYANLSKGGRTSKKDAQCLRSIGREETFMGLLCVFENGQGDIFTAGRLLFIRANGNRDWQNFTCPGELSLEKDFSKWETGGKRARKLTELGGMLHKSADDYFAALGDHLGFTSPRAAAEAFRAFDEAIGVKDMVSVNGFAQDYLLPGDNFGAAVDNAISSIEANYQSLQEIKDTRDQIELLSQLEKRMEEYTSANAEALKAEDRQHLADLAESISLRMSKRTGLRHAAASLAKTEAAYDVIADELAALGQEKESLDAALNSDEARRARELRAEMGTNLSAIKAREVTFDRMQGIADQLGITLDLATAPAWDKSGADIEAIRVKSAAAADDLRDEKSTHSISVHLKKEELSKLDEEIKLLDDSGSNLQKHLINARTKIAEAIGRSDEELPFVSELIRIRSGEEAWEGVANRVLDGHGRDILVDPADFGDAIKALNGTYWGGKVVLREARAGGKSTGGTLGFLKGKPAAGTSFADLPSDALASKLEVKEHAYSGVVEDLLAKAADHRCVSDEQIGSVKGKAVTRSGTVKNGARAEKDDKSKVNDRRHFILGWDTRDRKAALVDARAVQAAELAKLLDVEQQYNAGIRAHSSKADAAQKLVSGHDGWPAFASIEVKSLESRNRNIKVELAQLESAEVEELNTRLADVKAQIGEKEKEKERIVQSKGGYIRTKETFERDLQDLRTHALSTLRSGPSEGRIARMTLEHRQYFRTRLAEEAGLTKEERARAFTLYAQANTVAGDRAWSRVKQYLARSLSSCSGKIGTAGSHIQSLANSYLMQWPNEGQNLERGITRNDGREINYAVYETWLAVLERKRYDDLPRCEARVAEERDSAVEMHIEAIGAEINDYADRVEDMLTSINALLVNVTYDPAHDTRATLRYEETEDPEIVRFKGRFDAIARTAHNKEPEEVMSALRELLTPLMDNGMEANSKLRRKILRLANWKDVYVVEQGFDTNGDLQDKRSFIGKDGASGGQRERLTMLLLGAAQSYGMGGADPTRTTSGLQTIVLDEAFLRSSSETAQASTDILSAMGLQVIAATPAEKLSAFQGQAAQIITITSVQNQVKAQPTRCEDMFGAEGTFDMLEGAAPAETSLEEIEEAHA